LDGDAAGTGVLHCFTGKAPFGGAPILGPAGGRTEISGGASLPGPHGPRPKMFALFDTSAVMILFAHSRGSPPLASNFAPFDDLEVQPKRLTVAFGPWATLKPTHRF
jgi:hypothetical protein